MRTHKKPKASLKDSPSVVPVKPKTLPADKKQIDESNFSLPYTAINHHSFSKLPIHPASPVDKYEREADAMADRVIQMKEKNAPVNKPLTGDMNNGKTGARSVNDQKMLSQQSGKKMNTDTASFMSDRFGADLTDVKIHTDEHAVEMNNELNALAFTYGNDIYFNEGQYEPGSEKGDRLLAHELSHVLQQRNGNNTIQRKPVKPKPKPKPKPRTKPKPKVLGTGVVAEGGPLSKTETDAANAAIAASKNLINPTLWIAYKDTIKVGGSLAWRANNPGNLRGAATEIAKVKGGVGKFAVFASMQDGLAAQRALYLDKYGDQTVEKAVNALTPPSENDTTNYLAMLKKAGVDLKATVKSQIDTLMPAIEANEGMIEGVEVPRDKAETPDPDADSPTEP